MSVGCTAFDDGTEIHEKKPATKLTKKEEEKRIWFEKFTQPLVSSQCDNAMRIVNCGVSGSLRTKHTRSNTYKMHEFFLSASAAYIAALVHGLSGIHLEKNELNDLKIQMNEIRLHSVPFQTFQFGCA